ncbi:hypothetical protein AMECASPLE_026177, partial [Ameca splendens]
PPDCRQIVKVQQGIAPSAVIIAEVSKPITVKQLKQESSNFITFKEKAGSWRSASSTTSKESGGTRTTPVSFCGRKHYLYFPSVCVSVGGISNCCLKITGTKVHRDSLKSYYVEDPSSCTHSAVVFTTIIGRRICASQTNVWTKTSMAYLDGKNWQRRHTTLKQQRQ